MSSRILADARWRGEHGIARFAREVISRLPRVELVPDRFPLLHPLEPLWLTAIVLRRRPGAYFSPGFNPPPLSPVPVVFTVWDLIHLRFDWYSTARREAYYRLVVRPAARRASRVLTGSQFSKGEIVEWAGVPEARVTVVGSGVGPEFRPEGTSYSPRFPYLLYVGNRRPHKNLPRLLRAFHQSGLAGELRLVLSGQADAATAAVVHQLGLDQDVVFAGRISDSDLPGYYRGATALVFPTLYEGFGLPALEAMACGTPVLASNVTSIPEVAGDAAVLVDPYDVEAIANGIRSVVDDQVLRERCRERGLKQAKRFSWERTAGLTRQVLSEAVGG